MKFSAQWLREWVNPPVDLKALTAQLTMAGLEVESLAGAAGEFSGVLVGQVKAAKRHPEADRLHLCEVDVGQERLLPIVCGASNVVVGGKFPVAVIGAVLPGDFKIKKAKLRGEVSEGMLCAADELGLGITSEGIYQLSDDAPIGMDFREYLDLNDHIIDLAITPNRGDCLSIQGIARDVAAINHMPVDTPFDLTTTVEPTIKDVCTIRIDSAEQCPRYVGRVIKNINPKAETPLWMKERLRRSGNRSIYPAVDITNYVMLELGQPMHAFDLDKLGKEIVIRLAKSGEKLTLLDGETATLQTDTQIVAGATAPAAIAGVMGGLESGVNESTTDIVLEAAFFTPLSVIQGSRQYKLQSDACYRFERGVDPNLQRIAMERATQLVLEIMGGEVGPIVEATHEAQLPKPTTILLGKASTNTLLGSDISSETIEKCLQALQMQLTQTDTGWEVTPPSYRFDITIEADLIEEIARLYGYNNLPSRLPQAELAYQPPAPIISARQKIAAALTQQGYREVLNYTFVDPAIQTALFPDQIPLKLTNPISPEMSVMRVSLWPGLLKTLLYNQNRQQAQMRFFESGLCFYQQNGALLQLPTLAGAITGERNPTHWDSLKQPCDFFDLKAHLESVLSALGIAEQCRFTPVRQDVLHPGIAAQIHFMPTDAEEESHLIGHLGMLHPQLQKVLDLQNSVFLFEIKLANILKNRLPVFSPVSKYPAMHRDIAIVVDKDISYQAIKANIQQSGGGLLAQVSLFDIYEGEGIPQGQQSIALALTFQEKSRTLHEDEVNAAVASIVSSLAMNFSATTRNS